jgi:hypothetical protein
MLVIRAEQIAAFEQAMLSSFECSLVEHLREFAPSDAQELGLAALRRVVREGRESAARLGITDRDDIRLYTELMFLLGSGFATDPQYAWAAAALAEPETPQESRAAIRLHASAVEYTRSVLGEKREHLHAALTRLSRQGLRDFLRYRPFPESVVEQLHIVFPEKCANVGAETLQALVELAAAMAQKHGIATEPGIALFAILIFLLGHHVDVDPTVPWVEAALKATEEPLNRLAHLEREMWQRLKAVASNDHAREGRGLG